jgi:NADH dehydrogenase FAD-containing subunit
MLAQEFTAFKMVSYSRTMNTELIIFYIEIYENIFINNRGKKYTEKRMRIVFAGAGYTSIEVAAALKEKHPELKVTVINKASHHTLYSHIPELLSGALRAENATVNLERFFKKAQVEFIQGTITSIERNLKQVQVGNATVHYDYLVLDLSTEADIPKELLRANTVRGPNSALQLRQHMVAECIKARNTNAPEHKTFVVIGTTIAGVELATEMQDLVQAICEQHLLFPHEFAVVLVEQNKPEWPQAALTKIKNVLEERNIEYYADKVTAIQEDGAVLSDRTIETKTCVWAANKKANSIIKQIGLKTDDNGAAVINQYLQTSDTSIFAVGENSHLNNAPATAFISFDEQKALLHNLSAASQGKDLRKYVPPARTPIVITTGRGKAALIWGSVCWHGVLPYKLKNWIAMRVARRVHTKI